MLTGNFYRHSFAARPTWFLAPDDGSGDGGDTGDDDGAGDDDDNDDDGADDGDDDAVAKAETAKWKKLARKHEDRAKANAKAARELEELKKKDLKPDERALTEAEQRGRTAAAAEFAQQLAAAKIEAALTGIEDDPAEFVEDLNLAKFVTDDNEVDTDAIDELKARRKARMGTRSNDDSNEDDDNGGTPKPKADLKQGNRGKKGAGGKPDQLTREALKTMSPEQIEAARLAGQLNDVLGIKT